jgi:HAD superfamily hydrolase (TIGR01509 family)
MQPPDALIFDCDGVLVDSERLMNREFTEMLNGLGLPYTYDSTISAFMGRSMTSCVQIIESELGRRIPDDFLATLEARAATVFAERLQPIDGIVDALDTLDARGIRYAVASSGSHEKMRLTLGITGLLPRMLGRITSATEVAHGKPAPDVFLLAAERLGVAPSGCVVIEDSLLGIQAALAAGMRVVGYAAMVDASAMRDAGATWVIDDMRALLPLLAVEGSGMS